MASVIFNSALNKAFTGSIDFSTDTFKVMLVDSEYSPDKDAHNFLEDVTNEVSGVGYFSGGEEVAVTVKNDTANDRQDVSLGSASWPSSTITARGAVYYKSNGDELVAYIDFGSDVASSNGTFSLSASILRVQN